MKRIIALLFAAVLVFSVTACGEIEKNRMNETEKLASQANSENMTECYDLIGPWHLDEKETTEVNLEDVFPGYAEWGSSMEIRSNGQISWYIGAEGWSGTYEYAQYGICADTKSDVDSTEKTWIFQAIEDNGNVNLKIEYGEYELIWMYGEQEDSPLGDNN